MHVALASVAWLPDEVSELDILEVALRERGASVSIEAWDDPRVDWHGFDIVVIRATWDYPKRLDEFLAWVDAVGERLHNRAALVRWNADKHYLGDLAVAGIPVVETTFVEPGDPRPHLRGEVVVKPAVSAGGRDTGRFGPDAHQAAYDLLDTLAAQGRTAMVQPYVPAVDTAGETAVVLIDGHVSHVLHKAAVLAPDEVAPTRDDALGAAEAMYDPGLVQPGHATDDQLTLATRVVSEVEHRFGEVPLYARVDLVQGPTGEPVLLELEAVEPGLYHDQAPPSAATFAEAILRRATRPTPSRTPTSPPATVQGPSPSGLQPTTPRSVSHARRRPDHRG